LVGASESSAWARNVYQGLALTGATDGIRVVNPSGRSFFDIPAAASLSDLDETPDLAYLFVGPDRIETVLREAAAAGIRNAVILAAGFSEAGEAGLERQRRLAALAIELDMTLLGPNSLGFVRPGVAAPYGSGIRGPLLNGSLGLVLQSGSLTSALMPFALGRGIGCSLLAAVGNEAVVTSMDVFDYLLGDDDTRAIGLFLETLREPDRFMALTYRALEREVPVIVLKAGRSDAGKRAATAHTGAIASDDAVVDAAFRQAGVIRADSLEEFITTAGLLATQRRWPAGRRMAVVTSSGGGSNLIADRASALGFALTEMSPSTAEQLRAVLPPFASIQNPLDVTGAWMSSAGASVTKPEDNALALVAADPEYDLVVHVMTALPQEAQADPAGVEARIAGLAEFMRDAAVPPFTLSLVSLPLGDYPRELLARNEIHLLGGIELGLGAIAHGVRWSERRAAILAAGREGDMQSLAASPPVPIIGGVWSENDARIWLGSFDVPFVPAELVRSADDAAAAAERLGFPAVVKICEPGLAHKSDVGGVALRLQTADAVREAFDRVVSAISGGREALVSPMRQGGVELLVGVSSDPTFGAVLTVGLGGVWVEIMHDASIRVLPVSRETILEMLHDLRGFPLLEGARGGVRADLDAVVDAILSVAQGALALGDRLEAVEVNPLLAFEQGAEALDALVITRE
ncbi:MAG: acetate--CoA ligase family protein, partial [Pseudomonadota bacterium]